MTRVLVVDDEEHQRRILTEFLSSRGFEVTSAPNGAEALSLLKKSDGSFQFVITDLTMPELDGISLVRQGKPVSPTTEFLVLTGNGTMETAIEALRAGAADYLLKPVEFTEIEKKLAQLMKLHKLEEETRWLKDENKRLTGGVNLVSESPAMKKAVADLQRVVENQVTVLLLGETGSGKEVVARYLHESGPRRDGPFVAVNCSAISENLTESHFFGHEKGAFTGADRRTPGCFERADGGTLFLDEIGEMDLKLQPKILRVLEERQVTRVGGTAPLKVDVRIIAATNRDLTKMVQEGKFREDLLYRLNVVQIHLPPLRERKADLKTLVKNLVARHSAALNVKVADIDESYFAALESLDFPGNVRELSNIVERSLLYADRGRLTREALPEDLGKRTRAAVPAGSGASAGAGYTVAGTGPLSTQLESFERAVIQNALDANANDVEKAAKQLGISRSTLYSKMAKFGGT